MNEPLYDMNRRIIGYVEIRRDGEQVIKDKNLRNKDYYHPSNNSTLNTNRQIIGYGNQLMSLLNNDDKKYR